MVPYGSETAYHLLVDWNKKKRELNRRLSEIKIIFLRLSDQVSYFLLDIVGTIYGDRYIKIGIWLNRYIKINII